MIITAIGIPLFLGALWIVSGYLPTRNIAMPAYSVVARGNGYEIRHYDPYIIAETSAEAEPGSSGFRELFQYISGNNTGGTKLAMTAPVLKSADGDGEKLAMTAPVLKRYSAGGGTISFIMPPGGTPYNVGDGLLPADLDGTTPRQVIYVKGKLVNIVV